MFVGDGGSVGSGVGVFVGRGVGVRVGFWVAVGGTRVGVSTDVGVAAVAIVSQRLAIFLASWDSTLPVVVIAAATVGACVRTAAVVGVQAAWSLAGAVGCATGRAGVDWTRRVAVLTDVADRALGWAVPGARPARTAPPAHEVRHSATTTARRTAREAAISPARPLHAPRIPSPPTLCER